ncbi:MAG: hypothetical protein AB7G93_14755 [Bdellovibrionales bacterium]
MRRVLLSVLVFCAALSHGAFATSVTLNGETAKGMMEVLAGSGFEFSSDSPDDWMRVSMRSGPIFCHYTVFSYPDSWRSNVECRKGMDDSGPTLANPLALVAAIAPYADEEAGLGHRWISVKDIACELRQAREARDYTCVVETEGIVP